MIAQKVIQILFQLLYSAVTLVEVLIIIRCVLSFLPDWNNRFTAFIFGVTEPILAPCRAILRQFDFLRMLPIDLSPILAFILLGILNRVLMMLESVIWRWVGVFA